MSLGGDLSQTDGMEMLPGCPTSKNSTSRLATWANLAMFAAMFASQQITSQILEFHHHYGYSYHFIPIHITTTPNPIPPRDGRMECEFCGRKFNPASYERHQPICQKASTGTVPEGLANGYLVTLW